MIRWLCVSVIVMMWCDVPASIPSSSLAEIPLGNHHNTIQYVQTNNSTHPWLFANTADVRIRTFTRFSRSTYVDFHTRPIPSAPNHDPPNPMATRETPGLAQPWVKPPPYRRGGRKYCSYISANNRRCDVMIRITGYLNPIRGDVLKEGEGGYWDIGWLYNFFFTNLLGCIFW
jgi:hypothetical protein